VTPARSPAVCSSSGSSVTGDGFTGSLAVRDADPAAVAYLAEATPDDRVDLREPISA
jgi:hypothetical protein